MKTSALLLALPLFAQAPAQAPFAPLDNLAVSCWSVGAIPMILPNDFTGLKCVPVGTGITITLDSSGNAVISPAGGSTAPAPPVARLSKTKTVTVADSTPSTFDLPCGATDLDTVFLNGIEHQCIPSDAGCAADIYRYKDGLGRITTPLATGDQLTIQGR